MFIATYVAYPNERADVKMNFKTKPWLPGKFLKNGWTRNIEMILCGLIRDVHKII